MKTRVEELIEALDTEANRLKGQVGVGSLTLSIREGWELREELVGLQRIKGLALDLVTVSEQATTSKRRGDQLLVELHTTVFLVFAKEAKP